MNGAIIAVWPVKTTKHFGRFKISEISGNNVSRPNRKRGDLKTGKGRRTEQQTDQ